MSRLRFFTTISSILFLHGIAGQSYAEDDTVQTETTSKTNTFLDAIPATVDSMPTIFPPQSDHTIVPDIEESKDYTWFDQKHYQFRNKLQHYAHNIDDWFGDTNPDEPASASLRIIADTNWNKYDDFNVKPRVRGKIRLPTLEQRFSVVFGDDSLDNEIRDNIAISNENPTGDTSQVLDSKQVKDDNASLAIRWEQWENPWDIKTDVDLGVRSGSDIYTRFKAQKSWKLANDFKTHAEQIYRYGIDSKHYLRTNLEIQHARPNSAFISDQFNLTYTDDGEHNFAWDNRLFRQHQFFHHNKFNYGVYLSGNIENHSPDLNSYGPFVSWRQPFLRQWLFFQTEVNYYNNDALDRNHNIGALWRIEAIF